MTKTGLQLYSLKKYTKDDFFGTLSKVSDLGFKSVEFAGFFGVKAKKLKAHLNDLGLTPCGSHTGLDLLTDEFSQTMEYNLEIGNKYVYCPSLPADVVKNEYGWKKVSELFNEIGAKCQDMGIEFGYHNHDFEFKTFDGKTGYDILIANTDSSLVKLELDTFWAEYAGFNPIELMETIKDRLSLVHLKEMKQKNGEEDTSVGYGVSNTTGIINKAKELDVKYIIIEQEHFEIDNHFECVKKGLDFVNKVI
ncbi:MAG: sugar phosphate isomerase/epimerase [Clostridiales bacterium]|nr:sugar phosphate isomerase/epimerase [Clostridiales bacterium]